jgi:hypothetical protein
LPVGLVALTCKVLAPRKFVCSSLHLQVLHRWSGVVSFLAPRPCVCSTIRLQVQRSMLLVVFSSRWAKRALSAVIDW